MSTLECEKGVLNLKRCMGLVDLDEMTWYKYMAGLQYKREYTRNESLKSQIYIYL